MLSRGSGVGGGGEGRFPQDARSSLPTLSPLPLLSRHVEGAGGARRGDFLSAHLATPGSGFDTARALRRPRRDAARRRRRREAEAGRVTHNSHADQITAICTLATRSVQFL